jgi:uncharacterized protein
MRDDNVSLDLMEFVETNILPRYTQFDSAHQLTHVMGVIKRSIELCKRLGADVNMGYAIAAYHDLGLEGPRAIHHVTGGKILMADVRLRKWFSASQLNVMKEAIEDHRASASHSPRNIYGKIVAEADRDLEPDTVFLRTVEYGLDHYPEKNKEEQWQRFVGHMNEKYSEHGYIRLWIPNSPNEKHLNTIRSIINNKALLKSKFEQFYDEVTKSRK